MVCWGVSLATVNLSLLFHFFFIDERDGVDVFPHSVALTLIKDITTRWKSTYYMLERCLGLKPFITEVCREFNISPTLSERQWASEKQLVRNYVNSVCLSQ